VPDEVVKPLNARPPGVLVIAAEQERVDREVAGSPRQSEDAGEQGGKDATVVIVWSAS
jgi:hypothetical protein